jgi:preprotein translocase subunit YajC
MSPGPSGDGSGRTFLVMMALILVVMYFFMIRPQQKKQRQLQEMLDGLRKNDRVLTVGGIYGTIAGIDEKNKTLILKVADNVKLQITRSSVARVVEEGEEEKET